MNWLLASNDLGPLYVETVRGRFPVEPWNTASNLIFLGVIVYLAWRLRGRVRRHPFSAAALPLLAVGWVGGTLYHATRGLDLWFYLDYYSIFVLALLAMFYFWLRLLRKPVSAMTAILAVLLAGQGVAALLPISDGARVSAAYSVVALAILLPTVLHCALRMPRQWPSLALAVLCFAVAVTCREIDHSLGRQWFPQIGSHFLWHIFGGLATFWLVRYLFASEEAAAEDVDASGAMDGGALHPLRVGTGRWRRSETRGPARRKP